MRKISFHIMKGGVGKTSMSGNTAYSISEKKKVALLDGDPQGNTSSWFLTDPFDYELADILRGEIEVDKALIKIKENFYIIPTFSIDGLLKEFSETKLSTQPRVFEILFKDLQKLGFEYCICDLSPGMSLLEKYILASMDEVIPVLTPELFSFDGIEVFNSELGKINRGFGVELQFKKLIVNSINKSFRRHDVYYSQIKSLDYSLYTIPQDSKIPEAQIYNQSIFQYEPDSKSIPELLRLTRDIIRS